MVIRPGIPNRQRAALITELVVALAIVGLVLIPLSFGYVQEAAAFKALYYRAVAMELIDGEMEVLAAGEWRAFPPGRHDYPIRAGAATNLPPGAFVLTRTEEKLRLEWAPKARGQGGGFVREVKVK